MMIDRLWLADRQRNTAWAVPAVMVSAWVFAYSMRFGPVSVLAFYAVWAPLFLVPATSLWGGLSRPLLLLTLPAFALLSVVWSDRPDTTLRAAIQYGSTVVLGLLAARAVSLQNLARGLLLGGTLILLYSHANGSYAYDVVDGTYAFAGAFQSKNQLGLFASLTLVAAVSVVLLSPRPLLSSLPVGALFLLAAYTLWMTESATSIITVVLSFGVMGVVIGLLRFALPIRLLTLAALFVIVLGGAVAAFQAGALDSLFGAFGKDTTLTGRTYLWSRGIEIGGYASPTGLGYYAFWVPGRADAEELWLEFHILSFSGFHFHNTLIEGFVALGPLGVAMIGAWLLGLLLLSVRATLGQGRPGAVALLTGLSVLFSVRAFVEIDFLTPYTAGSFLVPLLLLAMAERAADLDALRRVRPMAAHRAPLRTGGEPIGPETAFSAGAK